MLKPASATPIGALTLGEILAETDLPEGAFSILPLKSSDADAMVEDERIKKLSFTGSTKVGWELRDRARKKHVTLELGGNAACIVERDADLDDAVERNVFGGYYQSGQSCISVQRIFVHESIYDAFRTKFVAAVKALKMGDPREEDTFIGPMISEEEAKRIERTIQDAVSRGGKLLCGGGREGSMVEPAVLENVPQDAEASCEEIFGPVTTLASFSDFAQAIELVNDSRYGLQAGVFTQRHRPNRACLGRARSGRRDDQRNALVPRRPHALRRHEGQRLGPRRHPLGDRQHDGSAAAGDSQSVLAV